MNANRRSFWETAAVAGTVALGVTGHAVRTVALDAATAHSKNIETDIVVPERYLAKHQ